VRRARGDKPLGQYVTALLAKEGGRSADRYEALVVDDAELERGLANGSLQVDTRLRDALAGRRAGPSIASALTYDASYLSDSAGVRDADVVRLRRQLDRIAVRVGALD
jgi:hypothetical protein